MSLCGYFISENISEKGNEVWTKCSLIFPLGPGILCSMTSELTDLTQFYGLVMLILPLQKKNIN